VRECIERHVDKHQLELLRIAEQSERELLVKWAGTYGGGRVMSPVAAGPRPSPDCLRRDLPPKGGMNDVATQEAELLEAWRAVANAKLTEFKRQCWRLSMLVRQGVLDKIAAVDRLYEIAIAHALVRSLGEERVEAIIGEAFSDVDFRPMLAEFAA